MGSSRSFSDAYLPRKSDGSVNKAALLPQALPSAGLATVADLVRTAWAVYEFAWPLVNLVKRAEHARDIGGPVLKGGLPVAYNGCAMLTDYITPRPKGVAAPNQDVAYGGGVLDLDREPIVFQVPDFDTRFWSYAFYDSRTDECLMDGHGIGRQNGTAPGCYMVVGPGWPGGALPAGIAGVVRSATNTVFGIARVYFDGTPEDHDAIQPLLRGIDFYPLSEFTGVPRTSIDWNLLPQSNAPWDVFGFRQEAMFVKPIQFFEALRVVLATVPERAIDSHNYEYCRWILDGPYFPGRYAIILRAFQDADRELIDPLMEWKNNGVNAGNGWNTSVNSGEWGNHFHHRTATAKSNIFESRPSGARYYYRDFDANNQQLFGGDLYEIKFPAGQLPPVHGFWSLTLYDDYHFFYPNILNRYSLGTKNLGANSQPKLQLNPDGSLSLFAGAHPGNKPQSNWLPAPPNEHFCLMLRAFWPDANIGQWQPPQVTRI